MGSRVRVPYTPQHSNIGTLTEWLGSGLQNRVQQFESAGYLNREQAITLFALFRFIYHHHPKAQSNPKYKSKLQAQNRAALPITIITCLSKPLFASNQVTHVALRIITLNCHTQLCLLQISPHKGVWQKMNWSTLHYALNLFSHNRSWKLAA